MVHFLNEYVLMRFTTFPEGTLAKIQFAKYFFNEILLLAPCGHKDRP